jgi:anti-sigma factor RsiW
MTPISSICQERELLLHGLADDELDAANAWAIEDHVKSCPDCAAAFAGILRHRDLLKGGGLRFRASDALRARVQEKIAAERGAETEKNSAKAPAKVIQIAARRFRFGRAGSAFSMMALAASLILFVNISKQAPVLDDELVSAHVRSMLVSHLTDVASSDRHTVKPWFLGKVDFAPPVIDLAQMDFPLQGGRLDYIGGRVVPALVYGRRGHVINLFIWPERKMEGSPKSVDGYNIVSWTQDGFAYAAVSDVNLAELQAFQHDLQEALKPG